jgi:hypothetical protein
MLLSTGNFSAKVDTAMQSEAQVPLIVVYCCHLLVQSITTTIPASVYKGRIGKFRCEMVTIYTTYFKISEFCILSTECVYVFHMVLTINGDYLPKHHYSDAVCFL